MTAAHSQDKTSTHKSGVGQKAGEKRLLVYTSAPWRAIARAASGNHWSQQMATPIFPNCVSKTLKPVSPGLK